MFLYRLIIWYRSYSSSVLCVSFLQLLALSPTLLSLAVYNLQFNHNNYHLLVVNPYVLTGTSASRHTRRFYRRELGGCRCIPCAVTQCHRRENAIFVYCEARPGPISYVCTLQAPCIVLTPSSSLVAADGIRMSHKARVVDASNDRRWIRIYDFLITLLLPYSASYNQRHFNRSMWTILLRELEKMNGGTRVLFLSTKVYVKSLPLVASSNSEVSYFFETLCINRFLNESITITQSFMCVVVLNDQFSSNWQSVQPCSEL